MLVIRCRYSSVGLVCGVFYSEVVHLSQLQEDLKWYEHYSAAIL